MQDLLQTTPMGTVGVERRSKNPSVDKRVPKPATFVGSSLDDLRDFPKGARRETAPALVEFLRVMPSMTPDEYRALVGEARAN